MICGLLRAHRGRSLVYYLDVSFEETLRRHARRPPGRRVQRRGLGGWYLPHDLLGVDGEQIVPEHYPLDFRSCGSCSRVRTRTPSAVRS
jgi:hypothetical protein